MGCWLHKGKQRVTAITIVRNGLVHGLQAIHAEVCYLFQLPAVVLLDCWCGAVLLEAIFAATFVYTHARNFVAGIHRKMSAA